MQSKKKWTMVPTTGRANTGKTMGHHAGFVASLLAVLRKGLRSFGQAPGERRMELIATLSLGGKRQLMLVVCDGQRILVSAGGDSVSSIAEMSPASPIRLTVSEKNRASALPESGASTQSSNSEGICSA